MKDFLIGFISGIFVTIGMLLWMAHIRILGMVIILVGWFLGVVVVGHYMDLKRKTKEDN